MPHRYTCGDLFLQDTLLRGAEEGLATILEATKHPDLLAAVGLPVRHQNKLYNCAAVLHRGEMLALVPKTYLPNYGDSTRSAGLSLPAPATAYSPSAGRRSIWAPT